MARIQIVSIIGSFLFLFFIFEIIRRKKLKEAYALIWVIMGLFFLILSCWLEGLHFFSSLIGIVYSRYPFSGIDYYIDSHSDSILNSDFEPGRQNKKHGSD